MKTKFRFALKIIYRIEELKSLKLDQIKFISFSRRNDAIKWSNSTWIPIEFYKVFSQKF